VGATPYHDWNTRITEESYRPNAEVGNFRRIGWDIGPTLATWLRRERPDVHEAIVAQENGANAMAQGYDHAILPLASGRDRRTEIRWGMRDFELRFGHRPTGIWLPETAVDLLTLRICAEEGLRYTILAPWQAVGGIEPRRPYRVELGRSHRLMVVFYDAALSASVSFEPDATADADRFARDHLLPRLGARPSPGVPAPLVTIATDGELYGHHQPFRDLFLARLTRHGGIGRPGFDVTSVGEALEGARPDRLPAVTVAERTSWSCHHGVARWSAECPDARDGRWKQPLRAALDRLAAATDQVTEQRLSESGIDAWEARDRFVDVVSEFTTAEAWAEQRLRTSTSGRPALTRRMISSGTADTLLTLMRAQASRLRMFASDGWYWEDPSRSETGQVLRFAAYAARLMDASAGTRLERSLVGDLAAIAPGTRWPSGVELYTAALRSVDQPPPEE
jgi:hypothetical protein